MAKCSTNHRPGTRAEANCPVHGWAAQRSKTYAKSVARNTVRNHLKSVLEENAFDEIARFDDLTSLTPDRAQRAGYNKDDLLPGPVVAVRNIEWTKGGDMPTSIEVHFPHVPEGEYVIFDEVEDTILEHYGEFDRASFTDANGDIRE